MRRAWLVLLAACGSDGDPRWQLDHDRIVAIRLTPSHVAAGEVAVIDGLVAHAGAPAATASPVTVSVEGAPPGLASIVVHDGDGWRVAAPDAATLDAARTALGLVAGAAVPVTLALGFDAGGTTLAATKVAWLGDARDNPVVGPVTLDGALAVADAELRVPFDQDVALATDVVAADRVNWLTSCGSLNRDDNEHAAIFHVERDDPQTGELIVVVRDPYGGVAWRRWPIVAEGSGATTR